MFFIGLIRDRSAQLLSTLPFQAHPLQQNRHHRRIAVHSLAVRRDRHDAIHDRRISPFASTVAVPGSLDVQVIVRPVSAVPPASRGVAVN